MSVNFWFEVMGDFYSNELWQELEPTDVNLIDLDNHVYVYGTVTPSMLVRIILICGSYGNIKGGDFSCD